MIFSMGISMGISWQPAMDFVDFFHNFMGLNREKMAGGYIGFSQFFLEIVIKDNNWEIIYYPL